MDKELQFSQLYYGHWPADYAAKNLTIERIDVHSWNKGKQTEVMERSYYTPILGVFIQRIANYNPPKYAFIV